MSAQRQEPPARKESLQGVARAVTVLRALAERPRRPSELVADLGLNWTTLHRTLAQLEREGFAERLDSGVYRIGCDMWVLGSAYLVDLPLADIGQRHVRAASEAIPGVAFQLCVRSGRNAIALLAEQQSGEEVHKATYGFSFPLHCGSKGQVLLAHVSEEELADYLAEPLQAITPQTITDGAELRQVLGRIRSAGLAKTIADVQPDTGSLAVPVRDHTGRVVASLTGITYSRFLNGGPFEEQLTECILDAARAVSHDLGWRAAT